MTPNANRILVVGCGAVTSELHVQSLRRLSSQGAACVVGLVDPDPARAAAIQREFPNARCYRDLDTALASANATLAIIASPPAFHSAQTVAAFQRGLHVLCEKPVAVTRDQCGMMLQAASSANRRLFVSLPRRLYPILRDLRALVSSGSIGRRLTFTYREGGRYSWPVATPGALRRSSAGGGVLMDKGSHALDLLIQIFGDPAHVDYFDDALDQGVETNCMVSWESAYVTGTVTLSWDQDLANGLHIEGDSGELTWDGEIDRLSLRTDGRHEQVIVSTHRWPSAVGGPAKLASPRNYFDCIELQLVQVIRSLNTGEPCPLDAISAGGSVAAIERCYQNAQPLPQPWLTAEEQAVFFSKHWARAV